MTQATFEQITAHKTVVELGIASFKDAVANAFEQQMPYYFIYDLIKEGGRTEVSFTIIPEDLGTEPGETIVAIVSPKKCIIKSPKYMFLQNIYDELKAHYG